MKTIDFIISYIKEEASLQEKDTIKMALGSNPPLEVDTVLSRMLTKCSEMWYSDGSKLQVVKYVKDVTGWLLKESKDWCDLNVFTKIRKNEEGNSISIHSDGLQDRETVRRSY